MDQNDIFSSIQEYLRNTPMILVGSGSSAAHGLPGMKELGAHLVDSLDEKYKGSPCWEEFKANLVEGKDLETALSDVNLSDELLKDIRIETWKVVSRKDLDLFYKIVLDQVSLPLSELLRFFCQAHPKRVNIVTTNYDRVIEYACDVASLPVNTGFTGYYSKHFNAAFPSEESVNLIKIHGSLDVFQDAHGAAVYLPLQKKLQPGMYPEIVTPGLSKFEAVLTGTPRQMLTKADQIIREAKAFLCIGYGFNDKQVQESVIQEIRKGTPLVLLTKEISDATAHLLANNARKFITICKGKEPNTTEMCINRSYATIDGTYWTIDGLMKIIS